MSSNDSAPRQSDPDVHEGDATSTSGADDESFGEREALEALLVFRVGAVWLAVNAEDVAELHEPRAISKLPRVPPHILGMISLRGQPVPLLDLSRFLSLPELDEEGESVDTRRFVIVKVAAMTVGLLCDKASRVVEVPSRSITEISVMQGDLLRTYARGETDLNEGLVAVLDLAGLLHAARVRSA